MSHSRKDTGRSGLALESLGKALPSSKRPPAESLLQTHVSDKQRQRGDAKALPNNLPRCFEEVWRRRSSALEIHQKERAALEAVAATVPPESIAVTDPSAAAGIYLAALVISLQRVNALVGQSLNGYGKEGQPHSRAAKALSATGGRTQRRTSEIEFADGMHATLKTRHRRMKEDLSNVSATAETEGPSGCDENLTLISSLLYLIALALKDASPALVNARCDDILDSIVASSSYVVWNPTVGRHAASAIAGTLSLMDAAAWTKPSVQRSYLKLTSLSSIDDAKTRKRSRELLCVLIGGEKGSSIRSLLSSRSAAQLISTLKSLREALNSSTTGSVATGRVRSCVIHSINSVVILAPSFEASEKASLAKELLLIGASKTLGVSTFAFNVLAALCSKEELSRHRRDLISNEVSEGEQITADDGVQNALHISTSQLGKVLKAMTDMRVSAHADEDSLLAFANCLSTICLAYCDAHSFTPPPLQPMALVVHTLVECIEPTVVGAAALGKIAGMLQRILLHRWMSSKPQIFKEVSALVGYRYKPVWASVLSPLRYYLEACGCAGETNMASSVDKFSESILSIRKQALASNDKPSLAIADSLIIAVLRGGGARSILRAAPLERDEKLILSNAWLLPLMCNHVRQSSIAFFLGELRPLAENLKRVAETASANDRKVEAKNAEMLQSQLWELLPAFCQSPNDLAQESVVKECFDVLRQCVEDGLSAETSVILQSGISGLRCLSLSFSGVPTDDESFGRQRKIFAKQCKTIFPILFTTSEQLQNDRRASILEAVACAAKACDDRKLIASLLRKALRRLLEASAVPKPRRTRDAMDVSNDEDGPPQAEGQTDSIRHAATDMAIAVAESGVLSPDCTELDLLERAMSPLLMDRSDSLLQKKAYRAMSLLMTSGINDVKANSKAHLMEMCKSASSCVAPSAKASRLSFIKSFLECGNSVALPSEFLEQFTATFLTEVVLGTRDVSEKTRIASFAALTRLAQAWNMQDGQDHEGLRKFLNRLSAGLAAKSVPMLASTLSSFGHVLYCYRGEASACSPLARDFDAFFGGHAREGADVRQFSNNSSGRREPSVEAGTAAIYLPGPVCILLRHSAKEVQKAALGVVKVATAALSTPVARLIHILPVILPGLVHVAAKSKKKEMRIRVRVILERLLRKCGRESLEASFPPEHIKLLAAVRKQHSRDLLRKHSTRNERQKKRGIANTDMSDGGASCLGQVASEHDSDHESDLSLDDSDTDLEREILDGDDLSRRGRHRSLAPHQPARMRDGLENTVDLLDADAVDNVVTDKRHGKTYGSLASKDDISRRKQSSLSSFKVADDGRPIIEEDEAREDAAESDERNEDAGIENGKSSCTTNYSRKRRAIGSDRDRKRIKGSFGEEYRSKRGAHGDMTRPGLPDPYAYVPLGGASTVSKASKLVLGHNRKRSKSLSSKSNSRRMR